MRKRCEHPVDNLFRTACQRIRRCRSALEPVRGAVGAIRGAVGTVAEFVGVPPGALLALVLIGVGFWILSKRREQRREGWS
jgi:hypothetical protein